jgi:carboxymethylenebutenolidase
MTMADGFGEDDRALQEVSMPALEPFSAGELTPRAHVRIPGRAAAGVVVLHPWWGLNDDVIAYADRLADAGFAVLAPDMFDGKIATEPAEAEKLAGEGDKVADTIAFAAVDELANRLGPEAKLAVLGFSFGAAYALWAPSERPRLAATVVYYGTYTDDFIKRSTAPVLGHFAEDDPYESAEGVAELETALREAGRQVEFHVYPGTGHWFAEPSRDAYRPEAAELAFERTVAFLRSTLGD